MTSLMIFSFGNILYEAPCTFLHKSKHLNFYKKYYKKGMGNQTGKVALNLTSRAQKSETPQHNYPEQCPHISQRNNQKSKSPPKTIQNDPIPQRIIDKWLLHETE